MIVVDPKIYWIPACYRGITLTVNSVTGNCLNAPVLRIPVLPISLAK